MKDLKALIRDRIRNRAPGGPHWEVRNASGEGGPAEIRIYDVIGWPFIEAQDIAEQLDQVTADEITVSINSPGGSVFESIAIYNLLRKHDARITTRVDGLAASGASIIAQAGDHRVMVSGSEMMIHNAWVLAVGDSDGLRKIADLLDKQDTNLANIYGSRAGTDPAGFLDLMSEETWFLDQEAVDAGLADEVDDPTPAEAQARGSRLVDQLNAVAADIDEVIDRVAEVASLRSDQGKSLDDSWRTRDDVDRLSASLDRLREALTPPGDEAPEGREEPDEDETTAELDALYLQLIEEMEN